MNGNNEKPKEEVQIKGSTMQDFYGLLGTVHGRIEKRLEELFDQIGREHTEIKEQLLRFEGLINTMGSRLHNLALKAEKAETPADKVEPAEGIDRVDEEPEQTGKTGPPNGSGL